MKTAVIIVNDNDEEDTIKYVNEIRKYETVDRVLVVDNLSTNIDSFKKLKGLENEKVKVISSDKNGGYAYGNNFGVKYLAKKNEDYDYIIISNPDIEIEEKAIKNCIEVLEKNNNIAIIAPRMFNRDNKPIRRSSWKIRTPFLDMIHSTRALEIIFYKILRNGEYSEKEFEQELLKVEAISGAFFVIRKDIFEKIGLFDENVFLFYEEDILAKKIKEIGYDIISLNTEKFIHYESQTIGKTINYYNKMKQLYKSKMYYHKKYNNINKYQEITFIILNVFRKIELLIEIPIRKILKK